MCANAVTRVSLQESTQDIGHMKMGPEAGGVCPQAQEHLESRKLEEAGRPLP